MYKILIVDDEEIVRRSIVRIVDWNKLGFSEVFQAENGIEALELALEVKPDLVLTDIKMPFMDGLELSANLREKLPTAFIVVVSGYDEFKYAQEAISLGVLDYILKPFGSATLTQKLEEIRKKMDDTLEQKNYISRIKTQLHQSLPLLKERFFNTLVCTPGSKDDLESKLGFLEIKLESSSYTICVIEPDLSGIKPEEYLLYSFAVKNIASETIGEKHPIFSDNTGRVVIIVCDSALPDSNEKNDIIIDMMNILHTNIRISLDIPVTIGVGASTSRLTDLYTSYSEALKALDCRYTLGKDRIYNISDLSFIDDKFSYPSEALSRFQVAVKTYEKENIKQSLNEICTFLRSRKALSAANVKVIFIDLTTKLLKMLTEIKGASPLVWSEGLSLYARIEKLGTVDEMAAAVLPFAVNVSKSFVEALSSNNQNVAQQAMDFIKANYKEEELSLISVASKISVSAGYLSALFKKETGINFSDYLTGVRMEEAMQLLRTTDMKTYEIAYRTGYSSPHYFSISFKKYTGKTPSEYRGVPEA